LKRIPLCCCNCILIFYKISYEMIFQNHKSQKYLLLKNELYSLIFLTLTKISTHTKYWRWWIFRLMDLRWNARYIKENHWAHTGMMIIENIDVTTNNPLMNFVLTMLKPFKETLINLTMNWKNSLINVPVICHNDWQAQS
jgi:hypothetical protein